MSDTTKNWLVFIPLVLIIIATLIYTQSPMSKEQERQRQIELHKQNIWMNQEVDAGTLVGINIISNNLSQVVTSKGTWVVKGMAGGMTGEKVILKPNAGFGPIIKIGKERYSVK